jgi:hypothetical protein
MQLLKYKPTKYTFVIILISQMLFYMFRPIKANIREVSCRMQPLWYNVLSQYIWCYGEWSMCIVYRME